MVGIGRLGHRASSLGLIAHYQIMTNNTPKPPPASLRSAQRKLIAASLKFGRFGFSYTTFRWSSRHNIWCILSLYAQQFYNRQNQVFSSLDREPDVDFTNFLPLFHYDQHIYSSPSTSDRCFKYTKANSFPDKGLFKGEHLMKRRLKQDLFYVESL